LTFFLDGIAALDKSIVCTPHQCDRSAKLQAIWGKTEEREATTCRRKNKNNALNATAS